MKMTSDRIAAIVLAVVAFATWMIQGETEQALGSLFFVALVVGVPAFLRQDDQPASAAERWTIIGAGAVMVVIALVAAIV